MYVSLLLKPKVYVCMYVFMYLSVAEYARFRVDKCFVVQVFGHLFPPSFKNWWSDDWISTVYGAAHTFVVPDVQIKHNVGAQKTKGTTRYEVDKVLYVGIWLCVGFPI